MVTRRDGCGDLRYIYGDLYCFLCETSETSRFAQLIVVLDLRSLTGKGADSDLSEALLVKTFHVAGKCASSRKVTLESKVVTKTCHEDGAFLVG
jgi:hypothetical protein